MGTRLQYEGMLKSQFPAIQKLRSYSPSNGIIHFYIVDNEGGLRSSLKEEVERFLFTHGMASAKHIVKPFTDLHEDNVPEQREIAFSLRTVRKHKIDHSYGIQSYREYKISMS